MNASLTGIRVLDLSRVLAGPLCSQLLADHGAEVVKVEAPAGDETRGWGPPFVDDGTSAYYHALNRNKTNVCLDLTTADGRRLLGELFASADVVVENFKAGTLARWGLPDEEVRRRFPRLVHCRITGFGVDGPMGGMPGYDAIAQAYGGLMSINGEPGGPPLRVGVPIVDMVTGIHAFSGILLALHERHRSGRGQLVECALLDTAISLLHPHSAAWLADGRTPRRTGSAHPSIAPYDTFEAADGLLFVGVGNDRQFRDLTDLLGVPELAEDPRFAANSDRIGNVAELRPLLAGRIATWQRHELARALLARGVPATAVHDVGEALTDPHVRHRGMVVDHDGYRGIGLPVTLHRTPGAVRSAPRDRGADTRRILRSLGYADAEIDALIAADVARD
ncbi:CaiB/BaiF CoA transferase family protein [Saccharopolyspora rosea]|uniref:CaiB/BaiF CoA transferase family protein n=1 Tax=Saccharopolyspora rosea TaxID=524884 RepID=A0ABW3G4Y9_9PSEU|nr:CoA transferase [Saccharopolyspora rosea]